MYKHIIIATALILSTQASASVWSKLFKTSAKTAQHKIDHAVKQTKPSLLSEIFAKKNTRVYGMQQQHNNNATKFGVGHEPTKRMAQLQTGNPQTLELVAQSKPLTRAHAFRAEAYLHNNNTRIRGEWYR